jgi:hypothetical protein
MAAAKGHLAIVKAVLQAQLQAEEPHARLLHDFHGHTPFQLARAMSNTACAALLNPDTPLADVLQKRRRHVPSLKSMAGRVLRETLVTELAIVESCRPGKAVAPAPSSSEQDTVSESSNSSNSASSSSSSSNVTSVCTGQDAGSSCNCCCTEHASSSHCGGNVALVIMHNQQPLTLEPLKLSDGKRCSIDRVSSDCSNIGSCLDDSGIPSPTACSSSGYSRFQREAPAGSSSLGVELPHSLEEECGVCFDSVSDVALKGCGHKLCLGCAKRMCMGMANIRAGLACPFCRCLIAGFEAA